MPDPARRYDKLVEPLNRSSRLDGATCDGATEAFLPLDERPGKVAATIRREGSLRYFTTMLALAATIAVAAPEAAEAQAGGGGGMMFEQVEATPKGTIGLGLIGAELGFVLPAAVGLDQTWAFVVFPLALGGAGRPPVTS